MEGTQARGLLQVQHSNKNKHSRPYHTHCITPNATPTELSFETSKYVINISGNRNFDFNSIGVPGGAK